MRFCLNIIRKIIIRVTSSKRYQNVRSDLTILGPFANVTLTLCVSWAISTTVSCAGPYLVLDMRLFEAGEAGFGVRLG